MKKTFLYLSASLLFLILAGCAQQAPVQSDKTAPATSATENDQTISILNFVFDPATVTVKTDATVTWVNNDSAAHKIVPANTGLPGFSSDNLSQGDSYSFTFAEADTFDYYCQTHPMMKGKVIVTP